MDVGAIFWFYKVPHLLILIYNAAKNVLSPVDIVLVEF